MEYIRKVRSFIKKNWFYIVLLFIVIFLFIALFAFIIPNYIFQSYKSNDEMQWSSLDVLAFYGAFLSFLGSVVLGYIAVYQNRRANKINKELCNLQAAQYTSIITITKVEFQCGGFSNQGGPNGQRIVNLFNGQTASSNSIYVYFNNQSMYPIVRIKISVEEPERSTREKLGISNSCEAAINLPPNQAITNLIIVVPPNLIHEEYRLGLRVWFMNIFGFEIETFLSFPDLSSKTAEREYIFSYVSVNNMNPNKDRHI